MNGKRKKYKNFVTVIEEAKNIIIENDITIDEISMNTNIETEFIRILFDDSTNTYKNISDILDFLKVHFVTRNYKFRNYIVTDLGSTIRINRIIKPKCRMMYNVSAGEFFNFKFKLKRIKHSQTYTDIFKTEMKDALNQYLENKITNKS